MTFSSSVFKLQHCNAATARAEPMLAWAMPSASSLDKVNNCNDIPDSKSGEQVVLSGQGKSWWQANPTNCRIRSELKPLSSSLQSRTGIYHMSKEVVSPKIPDEDDSLKCVDSSPQTLFPKGLARSSQIFERKSFIIPNFFVTCSWKDEDGLCSRWHYYWLKFRKWWRTCII